jgi:hypothetical protein
MARSATDFAEHNAQRTVQATNYGMSWLREIADQNLNQSKITADSWLTVTRKAVEALDQQASAIRQQSMVVAEETLSNTFDFLHRLSRMKDPHEFAQIQSDFVSRQAQIVGDQTKEFGQTIMKGASEITEITETSVARTENTRRNRPEAA